MADNELSILIKTQAELDALTQARDKIAELKDSMAEGSAWAAMLGRSIDSVDKVVKQGVGGTIPEAAHHMEIFGLKGHEANIAMRLLARSAGEAGHAIHLAFEAPQLAAIFAIVLAVHAAKESLDEYNKRLDEIGEDAAKPMTAGIVGIQKAWDEATDHLAKYKAALDAAGKDADPTTSQIKRAKELDDARRDAHKAEITRQGELEVARIQAQDKLEGKPQTQIDADVEAAKRRTQSAIDAAESTKSSQQLKQEQVASEDVRDRLEKEATEKRETSNKLAEEEKKRQDDLLRYRKTLDPTGDEGKKRTATQNEISHTTKTSWWEWLLPNALGGDTLERRRQYNLEKLNEKSGQQGREMDLAHEGVNTLTSPYALQLQKESEAAKIAADQAEAAAKANRERLGQLPTEEAQAAAKEKIENDNKISEQKKQAQLDAAKDTEERRQVWERVQQNRGTPEDMAQVQRWKTEWETAHQKGAAAIGGEIGAITGAEYGLGGEKVDIARLTKAGQKAITLAARAKVAEEAQAKDEAIKNLLAVLEGYGENTYQGLSGMHKELVSLTAKLKANDDALSKLKGQMLNLQTSVPNH